MARWRLMEAHYIGVPGTFWEQVVTDRTTGRQKRLQYPVPLHLDPKNPLDWNYKNGTDVSVGGQQHADGEIIVCWEGKGHKQDIVFVGNPTPGMEPVDDEAREISAKFSWSDPIKDFDIEMSYSDRLLVDLQTQVASALSKTGGASDNSEVLGLQRQMADMMAGLVKQQEAITKVLEQLASRRF